MSRTTSLPFFACAASLCVLSACDGDNQGGSGGGGGGGGGSTVLAESEPNDTAAEAEVLAFERFGTGDVATPGDVDFWRVSLGSGNVVRVELLATRLDQAGWDASVNVPRLTLWDVDGTTKLAEHDSGGFTSAGWGLAAHDLDVPLFRVPATGAYFVSVTQDDQALAGGEYAVRVSRLPPATLQMETEPAGATGDNDTFATAQTIVPGMLHGFHVDGESDYYRFTVTQPSHVRLEMTAYRNGVFRGDDDYYDPVLTLFDEDGTTPLQTVDDTFFLDPAVHYRLIDPGTYFVEVGECCGSGDAAYFLSFSRDPGSASSESEPNDDELSADATGYGSRVTGTTGPGDVDYFSFAGEAGDMIRLQAFDLGNNQAAVAAIEVDLLGTAGFDNGFPGLRVTTSILQASGTIHVRVENFLATTDYALELTRFRSSAYEAEPNGTTADAGVLDGAGRGSGVIDTDGDLDLFRFTASGGRLTRIVVHARRSAGSDGFFEYSGHGSGLSPKVSILDGLGAAIAASTSVPANGVYTEAVVDGLPTAQVAFVAPVTGTYFVQVESADGDWFPNHYYVVEVE